MVIAAGSTDEGGARHDEHPSRGLDDHGRGTSTTGEEGYLPDPSPGSKDTRSSTATHPHRELALRDEVHLVALVARVQQHFSGTDTLPLC